MSSLLSVDREMGRLLSGASAATFSTANAYIADVSGPEDRARNFGLVGVAIWIAAPQLGLAPQTARPDLERSDGERRDTS